MLLFFFVAFGFAQTYLAQSSIYRAVPGFFHQSTTNETSFENLGLLENTSWPEVVGALGNRKLLFLQRHGEGYHNIAPKNYTHREWTCYWQIQDNDGQKCGLEWADAMLTEKGNSDLSWLRKVLVEQMHNGLPEPDVFYVSPLRRTLQTWRALFHNITTKSPVVTEQIREKYGIGTESKRHNRNYIAHHFPNVVFESGFTQFDELWQFDLHESREHCKYRAKGFLDSVFSANESVIYAVTHAGFISSVLEITGHGRFTVNPGEVIPVVLERTGGEYKFDLSKPWKRFGCDEHSSVEP